MSKLIHDLEITGMLAREDAVIADLHRKLNIRKICEVCGGDGKETCSNPDHGLLDSGFSPDDRRLGCPVCGHDPKYKVKNGGICEPCKGTGYEQ